jgi:hypothetical protein
MKKPYNKRTDLEKLHSNWAKTVGLFKRGDFSVSIIRAATTVEIAANFVIRKELTEEQHLPEKFTDSLLKWANGMSGKFTKLILPITEGTEKHPAFQQAWKKLKKLNRQRNSVAHQGEFKDKKTAVTVLNDAREVIIMLVCVYEPDFMLKEIPVNRQVKAAR